MHPIIKPIALLVVMLCGTGAAPATAPATRPASSYGYDPRPDFIAFEPRYRELKRQHHHEYNRLTDELIAQQRRGRKTHCARQVLDEAKWYTLQTARFDDAARRLADLRTILAAPTDPHAWGQAADGSYACCTEQWFLKLNTTIDELIVLNMKWDEPKAPVAFLERINSPDKLRAYLDSVLIADVSRTGVDTRTELNHSTSALVRIILWRGTMKEIPTKLDLHPGLRDAILDFMDNRWQDPQTGYWGTWYRTQGGDVVKTADLSITYHLVEFRGGRVNHWPRILDTTLAIKDAEYPYGWLEDGVMSNHHNYDVAALFRLGWPHASEGQRARIRGEVERMLAWSLANTIEPDGGFKIGDENTLGGAFYFGTAFLNEVGYFNRPNRFWTDREFPEADALRRRILAKLNELKLDDPEAQYARAILWAAGFGQDGAGTKPSTSPAP